MTHHFAFENEKVAVEIDGSQHDLKEIKERDLKKDKLLLENDWSVYRINASYFIKNKKESINDLLLFLKQKESNYRKVGFYEQKSLSKKEILNKERSQYGLTLSQLKKSLNERKVERPPLHILLEDVEKLGYLQTGKKYNVSDNSIRKWIRFYQKYKQQ